MEQLAKEKNVNTILKKTQRKPPVIKQTLTSMYRIAKANPLLLIKDKQSNEKINDFGINNIKLPKSIFQPSLSHISLMDKLDKNNQSIAQNLNSKRDIDCKAVKQPKAIALTRTSSMQTKNNTAQKKTELYKAQTTTAKIVPKFPITNGVRVNKNPINKQTANKPRTKTNCRRSLSAEHYERKEKLTKTNNKSLLEASKVTQSLNDVDKETNASTISVIASVISPIIEQNTRRVTFKSPNDRCSISMKSYTPTPFRRKFSSTPTKTISNDLKKNLEQWLLKHQKPIGSFRHLKCYGLNHNNFQSSEDKENIEIDLLDSNSYENLNIITNTPTSSVPSAMENQKNYLKNHTIAQEALKELHKLILEGYPHMQCEDWLHLICENYPELEMEPHYWECRAAVEQTRGNITSAVQYLHTAIVHGAEVKSIDSSLEQLLQKFSLLNLNTSGQTNGDVSKTDRARIVLDARNIFKSSIIQFAIQEKSLKKKQLQATPVMDKQFIATPVRRSTRASRSRYSLTPGLQICNSLKDLDNNTLEILRFQDNSALR